MAQDASLKQLKQILLQLTNELYSAAHLVANITESTPSDALPNQM